MGLEKDTEVYMMSEGRKVDWKEFERIEEDRLAETTLVMKSGGKREREREREGILGTVWRVTVRKEGQTGRERIAWKKRLARHCWMTF